MSASFAPTRVAIVTGAAGGIGSAIARRLAADGFSLAVADVKDKHETLDALVKALTVDANTPTKAIAIACDVRNKEDVDALVKHTVEKLGRLDVMVANAGIAPNESFLNTTTDQLDDVHAVNVGGALLCYQAAARQYIAQGGGGKLIAASSVAGIENSPTFTAYSCSKFAVRALNQGAALELGKHGITANVYCPGPVLGDMWTKCDDSFAGLAGVPKGAITSVIEQKTTLGRLAQPEDVARLVSFLAGPDSNYITGQAIQCNGGAWLS